MKKFFLLLAVPVIMMVGCTKSELRYDVNGDPNELSIRPLASKMTKGSELTGISMPNTYGIYAAATQRNGKGIIENSSFFADPFEQLFGTNETDPSGIGTAAAVADNRQWHAGNYTAGAFVEDRMYWPIGGIRMDFLAYAMPMSLHQDVLALDADLADPAIVDGDWNMKWDNALTDVASQFTFYGVDTYAHQVDVLYAAANDQTNAANGGAENSTQMNFRHAQAVLLFNVKVNAEASNQLTINEIEFITDERLAAQQEHERLLLSNPAHELVALADDDVILKTVGQWRVDNSRNTLTSVWSNMLTKKENFRMPMAAITAPSNANSVVLGQEHGDDLFQNFNAPIPFNGYDDDSDPATDMVPAGYAQLGETLMIPEQTKVNFTIKYTLNDKVMYYKVNDLRGTWEAGKKYIYNLDLTMNEIVITEGVDDWVSTPIAVPVN